jgi:hypothetical protein
MSIDTKKLQIAIELHLENIEHILGPHYKLTLIANHDGHGGLNDADIVLTMSERDKIIKAIDKFLPA